MRAFSAEMWSPGRGWLDVTDETWGWNPARGQLMLTRAGMARLDEWLGGSGLKYPVVRCVRVGGLLADCGPTGWRLYNRDSRPPEAHSAV